jgi:hypothetical protein
MLNGHMKETLLTVIVAVFLLTMAVYRWFDRNIILLADWLLRYLDVLVWPAVVLAVAMMFKSKIADLIGNSDWIFRLPWGEATARQRTGQQRTTPTTADTKEFKNELEELTKPIQKEYEEKYAQLIQVAGGRINELLNKISQQDILLQFERVYNVIFGGQIDTLRILSHEVPQPWFLIEDNYARHKQKNPALRTWDVSRYYSFMITSGLMEQVPNSDNYWRATEKGKAFLEYLRIMNYPTNKPL